MLGNDHARVHQPRDIRHVVILRHVNPHQSAHREVERTPYQPHPSCNPNSEPPPASQHKSRTFNLYNHTNLSSSRKFLLTEDSSKLRQLPFHENYTSNPKNLENSFAVLTD